MNKLTISVSPHIRDKITVKSMMWGVVIALLPAVFWGIFYFQAHAFYLILTCVITAVLSEVVCQKILNRPITITDGSAFLSGLLLALVLPPSFPLWAGSLGTVISIVIGKHIFGGLGYNIFNPALLGRAFLSVAFPVFTTTWKVPVFNTAKLFSEGKFSAFFTGDAITGATPLALALPKFGVLNPDIPSYLELFFGMRGGCIGEVSALALLIGAVYLLIKKYIDWRIPLGYIGTVFAVSSLLWFSNKINPTPLFHILSGGLLIGAFFMATDPVTSPITAKGRWIFAVGAGILTISIRTWGGYPEGVMYSVLMMNAFTPLIERLTTPLQFGGSPR